VSAPTAADGRVDIRGSASADEIAAVLAVLAVARRAAPTPSAYERWRRHRLAAQAIAQLPSRSRR
jgi:hypothetical protein